MRKVTKPQIKFGEVDIAKIEFDLRSRDEIPKLLLGLQYIYWYLFSKKKIFLLTNIKKSANILHIHSKV